MTDEVPLESIQAEVIGNHVEKKPQSVPVKDNKEHFSTSEQGKDSDLEQVRTELSDAVSEHKEKTGLRNTTSQTIDEAPELQPYTRNELVEKIERDGLDPAEYVVQKISEGIRV